jgi:hypothetical protein
MPGQYKVTAEAIYRASELAQLTGHFAWKAHGPHPVSLEQTNSSNLFMRGCKQAGRRNQLWHATPHSSLSSFGAGNAGSVIESR